MFRRLIDVTRAWVFTLRAWLAEWLELLSSPIRSFNPRQFVGELFFGGQEAVSLGRTFAQGAAATIVGFFWFLLWLPGQLVGFVTRWVPFAWWWLRTRTRRQLAFAGLTAAVVLAGGVGPGYYLLRERRREARRMVLWRQYDSYLDTGNAEKLKDTLVALQQLSPGNTDIARRLDQLETREAPPSDTKFIRFLMRTHCNAGSLELAAREAAKLIDISAGDWEARYLLIEDAVRRGDQKAVREHLAALPRPAEAAESLPPHVALSSALLFQRLGEAERYDEVIEFMVTNVLQHLRREDLPHLGPDVVVLLVKCYHQSLTRLERYPRLTQYWVPVQQACRAIVDGPDVETRSLVALGETLELQPTAVLPEFRRRGRIDASEFTAMSADVEGRLRAIWERVLEREPGNATGYIGLACHKARIGDLAGGVRVAAQGLQACGNRPELITTLAKLLRESDPQAGLRFLQQSLRDEDMTPRMCEVYADVAQKAGRPDLARAACQRALRQNPQLVWAHYVEGEICLQLGKPAEAADALKPIRAELAKSPVGCALYVRVLCACGSYQLAEEFLEQVKAEHRPGPVLLEAARAMQTAGRPEDAVRWARQALDVDQTNPDALWVVADCTRLLAEKGDRGWDGERVREALQAYRAVQRQQPQNLALANNIAWLELKALGRPQDALESAALLRAVESDVGIPADYLETLGAVYLAVGQYEDALRMLEQAVATAGPRPGFFIHLALTHHALKHAERAEHYLNAAFKLPKNNRELADLLDASRVVLGR